MPIEIYVNTVSHFKATINATVKPEGLESDGIFISYQARPNIDLLLHKTGFVHSDMHTNILALAVVILTCTFLKLFLVLIYFSDSCHASKNIISFQRKHSGEEERYYY